VGIVLIGGGFSSMRMGEWEGLVALLSGTTDAASSGELSRLLRILLRTLG
jgi:hypothetical protein